MIWLAIALLAAVALLPLALRASRTRAGRGRREAALALHRAQLVELDRDLAEGRLLPAEHAAATLEVQRRLLADAALAEPAQTAGGARAVLLSTALIPLAAIALYLVGGHPDFPPKAPLPTAEELAQAARDEALIGQLRNRLALMKPTEPRRLEGYALLGNAELQRGHLPEAAAAFKVILAEKFEPTLAVETAEVLTEMAGNVTPEALSLFRRALAEAPPDAPWRKMAEKRVAQASGS